MKATTIVCMVLVWLLWIAVLLSASLNYLTLFSRATVRTDLWGIFPLGLLLGPACLSAIARWLIIPKWRNPLVVLAASVVGLIFADSLCLFGIFMFRDYRDLYFTVGLICILQFFPAALFGSETAANASP